MNCPKCGSAPLIGAEGWFKCGSTKDHSTQFCSYVAEFRKPLDAKIAELKDAGDRLFEELDDKTPDPRCDCIPRSFTQCLDCDRHKSSREALKEWKEAIK